MHEMAFGHNYFLASMAAPKDTEPFNSMTIRKCVGKNQNWDERNEHSDARIHLSNGNKSKMIFTSEKNNLIFIEQQA